MKDQISYCFPTVRNSTKPSATKVVARIFFGISLLCGQLPHHSEGVGEKFGGVL